MSDDPRAIRYGETIDFCSRSALETEPSLNTLAWPQVTVILLMILGPVIIAAWITARVRRAIICATARHDGAIVNVSRRTRRPERDALRHKTSLNEL